MRRLLLLGLLVVFGGALLMLGCSHDEGGGVLAPGEAKPTLFYSPDKNDINDPYITYTYNQDLTGTANVGIILVEFSDTQTNHPARSFIVHPEYRDEIVQKMFADDYPSVDQLYKQMTSHFAPADRWGMEGQIIDNFVIPAELNAPTCTVPPGGRDLDNPRWAWCAAAWNLAVAEYGEAFLRSFDALVYVVSEDNGCYKNISEAFHRTTSYPTPEVEISTWRWSNVDFAHELGHLYGFGHSNNWQYAYHDYGCFMGENAEYTTTTMYPAPLRHLNVPWKIAAGIIGQDEIQAVQGKGEHTIYLAPAEWTPAEAAAVTPPTGSATRAGRIFIGSDIYYVSYRQSRGVEDPFYIDPLIDPATGEARLWNLHMNRVHVHTFQGGGTTLEAILEEGDVFEGNGVTITALGDGINGSLPDPQDYVGVRITLAGDAPTVAVDTSTVWITSAVPGVPMAIHTATITNNDPTGEPATTYDISLSAHETFEILSSPAQVTLGPGASTTVELAFYPLAGFTDLITAWTITIADTSGAQMSGSAQVMLRADVTPPGRPGNFTALATDISAILHWSASVDGMSAIDRYEIERGGAYLDQVPGGELDYLDTTVTQGQTYSYRVRAFDIAGHGSAWTDPVQITTDCSAGFTMACAEPVKYRTTRVRSLPLSVAFTVAVTNLNPEGCAPVSVSHGVFPGAGQDDYWLLPSDPTEQAIASGVTADVVSSMNFTVVPQNDGIWTATVTVDGTNFPVAWVYDRAAPNVPPSGLVATAAGCGTALSWTAAQDQTAGIDHYQVWRNSVQIGQTTATTYLDTAPPVGSPVSYHVVAVDKANWSSASSNTAEILFPVVVIDETAITTVQDPLACTMTVTWPTNVPASAVVYYGASTATMFHYAEGSGGTAHVAVCDMSELGSGTVFYYRIVSANACTSDQTADLRAKRTRCIAE